MTAQIINLAVYRRAIQLIQIEAAVDRLAARLEELVCNCPVCTAARRRNPK